MRLLPLAAIAFSFAVPAAAHPQCELGPVQQLVPSGTTPGDWVHHPDVDGNFMVVGAPFADGLVQSTGAAYVYEKNGSGSWVQRDTLTAPDLVADSWFGKHVAIDGDLIAVGATHEFHGYSGAVYLYRFDGVGWGLEQKLEPSDQPANGAFGSGVFIDEDQVIVGAYKAHGSGRAYIFARVNGTWIEQEILQSPDPAPTHSFASHDCSIQGDVAIVGSRYDPQQGSLAGAAFVFRKIGTTWVFDQKLLPVDGAAGKTFGWWLEMDGQQVIVGAPDFSSGASGAAYIFERVGNAYVQAAKVTAPDATPGANFGYSTSICGDWAAVGARWADAQGPDSGSVYLYKRNPAGWEFHTQVLPSEIGPGDQLFGVALGEATIAMGALGDDDAGLDAGAAYVAGLRDGAPAAAFSVSRQSGKTPVTVSFFDESTGEISAWHWDFGNGYSSSVRNPVFTYHETGSFFVTLTVTGPCGNSVHTMSDPIVVRRRIPNAQRSR